MSAALEAVGPAAELLGLAERLGQIHDALTDLALEVVDLSNEALRLVATLDPQEDQER